MSVVKKLIGNKLAYASSQFDFTIVIEMESVFQVFEINAAFV